MEAADEIRVCVVERGEVGEGAITPIVFSLPGVAFEWEAEAAEFAEYGGAFFFERGKGGAGVSMEVADVADGKIVAAAGAVHEARGVMLRGPVGDVDRVELAPGFVKGNP